MITQAETGLSVCGIQGNGTHKKCLFSLRVDTGSMTLLSIKKKKRKKPEFPGFSSLLLLQRAHVQAQNDWSRKRESIVRVPIAQI